MLIVLGTNWDLIDRRGKRRSHILWQLIVEVSDSTLNFDLTVKAALYARPAMIEYWVIDILGNRLIVHREPSEGVYASIIAYGLEDELTPLAAPDARFCLARL